MIGKGNRDVENKTINNLYSVYRRDFVQTSPTICRNRILFTEKNLDKTH